MPTITIEVKNLKDAQIFEILAKRLGCKVLPAAIPDKKLKSRKALRSLEKIAKRSEKEKDLLELKK